jgi:uncharacterized SAM-binding protein YcdF (DUF218 family)
VTVVSPSRTGPSGGPTWRPLRNRWRRALAALVAAIAAFVVVTARVFVWPTQSAPAQASAIVLFAGPGDRLPVALQLAREHRAPVLVVSQGWDGYGGACPPPTPGVRTICFDPNPGDTRGEAEYVGRLARRYGWNSLILVVTRPQAVRAQMLVARCFDGTTAVVVAPVGDWLYQLAYGWGALVKAAFLYRAC